MSRNINFQYYVEGDDEKCILNVLKTDLRCIIPGRVEKFNVVQERFTISRIRTIKTGTVVVLVFDTDTNSISYLQENVDFLKKQKGIIKRVICIPQVHNLEEELVHSCNIKTVEELTQSRSKRDFKRDLLTCSNIGRKLEKCEFAIERFWSRVPKNDFAVFGNDAFQIKLK